MTDKVSVARVSGNVKGIFEYALSPCTLIVGKNAQGKSKIVDTLSLALTGQARSDGLGKRESDLMLLAPDGADSLYAAADLTDERTVRWSCSGSTAKATRAVWTPDGPFASFVSDEAIGLLRAEPKRLRAALIERIGGVVTQDEIASRIDQAHHETILPMFAFDENNTVPIDDIIRVADVFKERLKDARAEIKRFTAAYETRVQPLMDEEVAELAELEQIVALGGATREQVEETRTLRTKLAAQLAEITLRLEELDVAAGPAEGIEHVAAVRDLLAATVVRLDALGRSECKCICCGQDVTYTRLAARRDLAQAQLDAAHAVAAYAAERDGLERRSASLVAQIESFDAALYKMEGAKHVDRERLRALRERALAAQAYIEAAEVINGARNREIVAKGASDAMQVLVTSLMDARTAGLQRTISAALPRDYSVEIELRDGTRQVCRVGMSTGKGLPARDLRVLSGAERALLVSAFASTVVAGNVDTIPLVLIDDVWLDRDTLRVLLKALGRAVASDSGPAQAIVTAVAFRGAPPDGWTMINLGGE